LVRFLKFLEFLMFLELAPTLGTPGTLTFLSLPDSANQYFNYTLSFPRRREKEREA
jgi:hypothetical protein